VFCGAFKRFQLHIVDLDPSSVTTGGWLEDTSLVEKYNISEEDYAKRTDSFRKFKEKRVSQNPAASEVKVGDRCQFEAGEKRGVVKYVGRAESLGPGYWVGIQYDEPLGKHDGMYVNFFLYYSHIKFELLHSIKYIQQVFSCSPTLFPLAAHVSVLVKPL
ncbi:tubulin-folding cofactor B-like, partial [Brassica napus]|uniref:tubulin-folding cofactor B-like n=1 Tax=Brassica napus TaxID=3708 RepID=UPI00207915B6